VQPHAELHHDLSARGPLGVQLADASAHRERRARRGERAVRRIAHRAEDGHDPVPGELVEDAAVVEDASRHGAEVRVHRGDRLLRSQSLRERGRIAEVREQDGHGLALAFESERIALDHALDDRRGEKPLESAAPVQLENECAHGEDDRTEHEPVVFPPGRRPDRSEELRDLSLRAGRTRRRARPAAATPFE
jgi:hypothetical protein